MEHKKPSLYAAIAIGVSSMIGSGWLFASYYAAKETGPASILSWVVGAFFALILALLLAEIATMFSVTGLFSRLLTLTHNRDYGFIVAISNWLGVLIVVPSEAEATVQYLSTVSPKITPYIFLNGHLTWMGIACTIALLIIYWLLNYWGMKSLARSNNIITAIKVIVPIGTALIIMAAAFHPSNFHAYKGSFMPYGPGSIFHTVVNSGIFYSFYGFNMIAMFAKELKNPKKNIPIALISAIFIALLIYILLQVAFIGAIPQDSAAKGWHQLNFTSPLAQLAQMLGLNVLMIILQADAAVSPSGTAIIFAGSGTRMLTGMSIDKQMPGYFSKTHEKFHFSRRSLTVTILLSIVLTFFFTSWQTIMVLVSVLMLIACIAVPLSFFKLRIDKPDIERVFRAPVGRSLSVIIYLFLTYLLSQASVKVLVLAFVLHVVFFLLYSVVYYHKEIKRTWLAFLSCWTMFLYLALSIVYGYLNAKHILDTPLVLACFVIVTVGLFYLMLNQKSHQLEECY